MYLNKFYPGWGPDDCFDCEIEGCGACAVDIHHIEARGMGGRPSMDNLENLMGLCRYHHELYGDKKEFKEMLKETHFNFMTFKESET